MRLPKLILLLPVYWFLGVASLKLVMANNPVISTTHKWYDATLNAYDGLLEASPIGTKCATSAVGFFIGDAIAQCLGAPREKVETVTSVHKTGGPLIDIISVKEVPRRFDFRRSAIMTTFGLFLHGPFCHHLFNFLEALAPGREWDAVLQKVLLDQVVFCPLFSSVFLAYVNLLAGKKPAALGPIFRTDLPLMVFTSWKVWGLVHVCSYLFIPLRFRVLFVNAVQIFYSVFLSIIGNKSEPRAAIASASIVATSERTYGTDQRSSTESISSSATDTTTTSSSAADYYDEALELSNEDDEQYM